MYLWLDPVPQVTEQPDQGPQKPQWPSRGTGKNIQIAFARDPIPILFLTRGGAMVRGRRVAALRNGFDQWK